MKYSGKSGFNRTRNAGFINANIYEIADRSFEKDFELFRFCPRFSDRQRQLGGRRANEKTQIKMAAPAMKEGREVAFVL